MEKLNSAGRLVAASCKGARLKPTADYYNEIYIYRHAVISLRIPIFPKGYRDKREYEKPDSERLQKGCLVIVVTGIWPRWSRIWLAIANYDEICDLILFL